MIILLFTVIALVPSPVTCMPDEGAQSSPNRRLLSVRTAPAPPAFKGSLCLYSPGALREAYNLELILDESWVQGCDYLKHLFREECPEYDKDISRGPIVTHFHRLCYFKVRLSKRAHVDEYSHPKLGPLGCVKAIMTCLEEMLNVKDDSRLQDCEEVPRFQTWASSNNLRQYFKPRERKGTETTTLVIFRLC